MTARELAGVLLVGLRSGSRQPLLPQTDLKLHPEGEVELGQCHATPCPGRGYLTHPRRQFRPRLLLRCTYEERNVRSRTQHRNQEAARLIKRFQQCDVGDHQGMPDTIASMKELLDALDAGTVPNDTDYSLDDLAGCLTSLVEGQRESLGRTMPGSWAVVPNVDGLDAEMRVEFVFGPTYIATATLARCLCDYPLTALAIPGYREALQTGMLFSAGRNLQGHGYDATAGAIDALGILSLGKVPWLLHRHPEFCPELKASVDEAAAYMARCLDEGSAAGSWGEDYAVAFASVLESLRVRNALEYLR